MKNDIGHKLILSGYAFVALAPIMLFISVYSLIVNKQFIEKSTEVEASIYKLAKEKVFIGKSYHDKYTAQLGFFTEDKQKRLVFTVVKINNGQYHSFKIGDKLTILYLKEKPEEVRIKKIAIAFNAKAGFIISSISFFLGLLLIFIGKKHKPMKIRKQEIRKEKSPGYPHEVEGF